MQSMLLWLYPVPGLARFTGGKQEHHEEQLHDSI